MYILKFARLLKVKTRGNSESVNDLLEAERYWLRESQFSLLSNERYSAWKQQFRLFTDRSGLLRCQGRLANADIPYETRYPVLLSPTHHLTTLIVKECHEQVKRNGVKETLTQLRSRYWLVKGRSLVRKLIYRCVICRRIEGKPYTIPPAPALPDFRVSESPPFTYTGLDFAGPLIVRPSTDSVSKKAWICLYTCCVIRAVHLDVVSDLSTQTFLNSFRRFTSRRGFPVKLISDNGKTFKSAAKVISKILMHHDVKQHFSGLHVTWSFNLERAPWWGGFFERMVKSVKRCLKKTIGNVTLSYDELLTAVAEVEMVLNSRPLSFVSTEDMEEPLTPSHLLIGRRVLNLPVWPHSDDPDYGPQMSSIELTKRMQHFNKTLDHFWKRWRSEYLVELRESHRYQTQTRKYCVCW